MWIRRCRFIDGGKRTQYGGPYIDRNVGRVAYRLFQTSLYEPGIATVSEIFGGRAVNANDYMLPPVPQAASFPRYHGMASAQCTDKTLSHSLLNSHLPPSPIIYITSMTAPPKIRRPATTLLALVTLAVIAAGCAKTAVRKDAAPVSDTVQTAAAASNVIRETFTDSRDGKTYRTVRIGNQTWMAENLNFATDSSACYDNADSNCTKYGLLYNWDDAVTACPAGWRVPSDEDWDSLALAAGGQRVKDECGQLVEDEDGNYYWKFAGKKLKSTTGWKDYWEDDDGKLVSGNGTNDFVFSALPGGYGGDDFYSAGGYGYWWSATEFDASSAWYRNMYYYNDNVYRDSYYKTGLFSLRCLQDSASSR